MLAIKIRPRISHLNTGGCSTFDYSIGTIACTPYPTPINRHSRTMTLQPLLFHPILREKVWGGRFLEHLGKPLPPGVRIGESWELADLPRSIPDGRSMIAAGPFAGLSLRELISRERDAVMGRASLTPEQDDEHGFPLLIKFLDARENLSVQVHPDEAYVRKHPESHLKSEAWVIIDADPGAVIYKGLKPGITRESFLDLLRTNRTLEALQAVPAKPGECHYLPSGTVHALGAGVVVAEVQTPSDTTFRLYDWGRDAATTGRGLHLEQALECMRFGPCATETHPPPTNAGGVRTQRLVRTSHFTIFQLDATPGCDLAIVPSGMPEVWMTLKGEGEIHPVDPTGSVVTPMALGSTILIPASLIESNVVVTKPSTFLRITLPSSTDQMIAQAH